MKFARPYTPERFLGDINLVLEEVIGFLENDEKSHGREVIFEKDLDRTIPKFPYDRDQIRQVIWNMALNSLNAMPDGGVLRIRSINSPGHVEIEVIDNGKGIAQGNLKSIFQPFYTTRKEGTGLGLAIASKIMEAHGGKIDVESEVGRGTKFTISLPIEISLEDQNGR